MNLHTFWRAMLCLLFTGLFGISLPLFSLAQTFQQQPDLPHEFRKGELIVRFKPGFKPSEFPAKIEGLGDAARQTKNIVSSLPGVTLTSVEKTFKVRSPKSERLASYYTLKFDEKSDISSVIRQLENNEFIELIEKVPVTTLFCNPNDPYFVNNTTWHLNYVNANNIWCNQTTGCNNVVIAIVDDAVRTTHEDLVNKIVGQKDVADNDNNANPPGWATNSVFTHGTHVAGIAGAETNNGVGIASLGFNTSLYAIKCTKDNTSNPNALDAPYEGVEWAINAGVDVINMSWGGGPYVAAYQDLFNDAFSQGIICVAAAGNSNFPASFYPAAYQHVISVAASDSNGARACFSNYGAMVDIAAPGENIFSTLAGSNSSYGVLSGTSMAAPLVSAQVALLKCLNPALNTDQIEYCLTKNTFPLATNTNCNPPDVTTEGVNMEAVFDCNVNDIPLCLPPGPCQLVYNGDFEQIIGVGGGTTNFANVCFWDSKNSSPYFCDSPDGNSIGLWLTQGDIERVTSENPLNLIPGQEYHLSFSYHVTTYGFFPVSPLGAIVVALSSTNNSGPLPVGSTVIGQVNSPSVDVTNQQNHVCHATNAVFHEYATSFTYNGNGSYLNLTGIPGTNGIYIVFVDNVSIRPKLDLDLKAVYGEIKCGRCDTIYADGSGWNQIIWEPEDEISYIGNNYIVVCPTQNTTYTATVFDTISGCSDSRQITIELLVPYWEIKCVNEDGYFCVVDQYGNSPVMQWVEPFAGSWGHCQSTAGLQNGDTLRFIIYTFYNDIKCEHHITTVYNCNDDRCACKIENAKIKEWPECWKDQFCLILEFDYTGTLNLPLLLSIDYGSSTPGFTLVSVTSLTDPNNTVINGHNVFELCFTFTGECDEDGLARLFFKGLVCEEGDNEKCFIKEMYRAKCCNRDEFRVEGNASSEDQMDLPWITIVDQNTAYMRTNIAGQDRVFHIYGLDGKSFTTVNQSEGSESLSWDITVFPSSVYIVSMTDENGHAIIVSRFVVTK